MKISAIILVKNEENLIEACLKSLAWVDEVIVISNGSTDKTDDIATKNGARVVRYKGAGFSELRNRGLKEAKGDWIFYIDADERIMPELRSEIEDVIKNPQYKAYAIPRKNFVFGKEMKHCGFTPDYVKRLFQKKAFKKWTGELHEEPNYFVDGQLVSGGKGMIGHLRNKLIHIKQGSLSEMVEKTNRWSEIEAQLMFDAHHPKMNLIRFFTAIFREFWLRMVKQLAFLDGAEGVIYGIYQVYSRFISYAKLWELQLKTNNSNVRATT